MSRPPEDASSRDEASHDDRTDQEAAGHEDSATEQQDSLVEHQDGALEHDWHPDDAGLDPEEEFDESLAQDVLDTGHPPEAELHHEDDLAHEGHHPARRRRNPLLRLGAIATALVLVLVGGYFGSRALGDLIPSFSFDGGGAPEDYEGEGTGEVTVEIPQGAGGSQIGEVLAEAGVVASPEAFANVAAVDPRAGQIQPGRYIMAEQMSAGAAMDRLLDPDARQVDMVTIREGLWTQEVFAILAEETGNEVADYEKVDPAELDLPEAAEGELEGYLAPDTYSFSPSAAPAEQLNRMIRHGASRYEQLGIPEEELDRTLTTASLILAEAAASEDLPKVARVILNRLDEEEPLGFDSTIHFIHQERGRVGTTDEQREVEDPYNTYRNEGLSPGPINSPGAAAIEAALNPAEGDWMFFVTINPDTGETVFTDSYEEHQEQEKLFLEWCEANQDRC